MNIKAEILAAVDQANRTRDSLMLEFRAHGNYYEKAQMLVRNNQDEALSILVDPTIDDETRCKIWDIGAHSGSMAKRHNTHWAGLTARVRSRENEIPGRLRELLRWLLDTHGW